MMTCMIPACNHGRAKPRRRDDNGSPPSTLAAAAEVIMAVEQVGLAAEINGRSSASWIQNLPNARGNVSNSTALC